MSSTNLIEADIEMPETAIPTDQLVPTDRDLIDLFLKKQVEKYGFSQIELWFAAGFEVKVISNKVLWVK